MQVAKDAGIYVMRHLPPRKINHLGLEHFLLFRFSPDQEYPYSLL